MDLSQALAGCDFAVLGDPISHSLSPVIHNAAFEAAGLSHRYGAARVPLGSLDEAVRELGRMGFRGANVTVPLKAEAAALGGFAASDRVEACASANTLDFALRKTDSTDGPGLLEALAEFALPAGARALLLGAGGSARAVLPSLQEAGFEVTVWARRPEAARALTSQVLEHPTAAGFDVILDATAAGLAGGAPPIEWGEPGTIAYCLAYGAPAGGFLADASANGWPTADGRTMLLAQAALSWEIWMQQPAPRDAMRQALAQVLR